MPPVAGAAMLTARRSVRFVAWARAWRAGLVPFDQIAEEIAGDEEHMAADVPGTWCDVSLRDALPALARTHPDHIRLVLPAPGDPRGLPGPGPFVGAALVAGEAVVAGALGLVPEVREHTSGSGMTFSTVLWRAHPLPEPDPAGGTGSGVPDTAEAEADLSVALAETTAKLTRLDIAQWRPELAGALAAVRRPDGTDLPPGFGRRARRLYARAAVLDRVLALAGHTAPGGAVTGYEAQQRDAALRPLATACRRALAAACNAPLTVDG